MNCFWALVPLTPAVIVTTVWTAGAIVVIVKFALVAPAGTVTVPPTVATAVLLEERVTTVPPAGAGPVRVTVPVAGAGAVTVAGAIVSSEMPGAVTVTVLVTLDPLAVAVTVTVAAVATGIEVNVKVVVVEPAGMVAVAGTVPTVVFDEERATAKPAAPAALEMVMVPVDGVPPMTDVGLKARLDRVGAEIVSAAVLVVPFAVAEIFAVAFAAPRTVVTVA